MAAGGTRDGRGRTEGEDGTRANGYDLEAGAVVAMSNRTKTQKRASLSCVSDCHGLALQFTESLALVAPRVYFTTRSFQSAETGFLGRVSSACLPKSVAVPNCPDRDDEASPELAAHGLLARDGGAGNCGVVGEMFLEGVNTEELDVQTAGDLSEPPDHLY